MTVLAVAEHRRGELRSVSLELLTAGRQLADALDTDLHTVVVGGDVETFADRLNREGVDAIHTVAEGEEFNHDIYTQALTQAVEAVDATHLLAGNTVNGLDYVPALASRLDWPLVTDAIAVEAADGLVVTRELYASKAETTIAVDADRAAVTLRPGEWPAVDITDADVLVAVGRGIGEEENLDMIFDLAEAMGATVAASRPLIDNGWLEPDRQVGQSGKVVTPDVYLAVGISGAVQHVAGMKGSDTIVAINDDPSAPIFDVADYGIVGDLFDVVPALTDQLSP